jgi:hypothetical protein
MTTTTVIQARDLVTGDVLPCFGTVTDVWPASYGGVGIEADNSPRSFCLPSDLPVVIEARS